MVLRDLVSNVLGWAGEAFKTRRSPAETKFMSSIKNRKFFDPKLTLLESCGVNGKYSDTEKNLSVAIKFRKTSRITKHFAWVECIEELYFYGSGWVTFSFHQRRLFLQHFAWKLAAADVEAISLSIYVHRGICFIKIPVRTFGVLQSVANAMKIVQKLI